jgi:hypothetical protein
MNAKGEGTQSGKACDDKLCLLTFLNVANCLTTPAFNSEFDAARSSQGDKESLLSQASGS